MTIPDKPTSPNQKFYTTNNDGSKNNGKYKPYPSYKNSGVEWLGKVPSRWYSSKLKYHALVFNGNSISDDESHNMKTYLMLQSHIFQLKI